MAKKKRKLTKKERSRRKRTLRRLKEKVYRTTLDIAQEIARQKQGALFIIAHSKKFEDTYDELYPQITANKKIDEPGMDKVLQKLATLDGAVLISNNGRIIAYGAKLKKTKSIQGYGTRHAAAAGITEYIRGSIAILVSEEINWIRIFKSGNIIIETDASELPKKVESKVVSYMSSEDKAIIAALAGGGTIAAIIGSPLVAPIIIAGGTYIAIRTASGFIRKRIMRNTKKKRK